VRTKRLQPLPRVSRYTLGTKCPPRWEHPDLSIPERTHAITQEEDRTQTQNSWGESNMNAKKNRNKTKNVSSESPDESSPDQKFIHTVAHLSKT
jgi:hypothetical protein